MGKKCVKIYLLLVPKCYPELVENLAVGVEPIRQY